MQLQCMDYNSCLHAEVDQACGDSTARVGSVHTVCPECEESSVCDGTCARTEKVRGQKTKCRHTICLKMPLCRTSGLLGLTTGS